jgi:hypothetical protein
MLMRNRRSLPYLVALLALLAALIGPVASPVHADNAGHNHGDDQKHDGGHKKDKPPPDPTEAPTVEVTLPPEPTETAIPEPTETTAPTAEPTSAPEAFPAAPPVNEPAAPPGPFIDPSTYQIAVTCKYYEEKDATACRFTVDPGFGGIAANHAILTSALCTEVMSGEVGYVDWDAATGTQGYWLDQANDRMVLVGQVRVKGHAHYAVQVGSSDFKLSGPGLSCGVSKSGGTQIIVSKYICSVPADDPRAGESAGFVQYQNVPFEPPAGADRCRHVAEGETSFTLDYVDGVPSAGGLPTRANGRVRFTGVREGRYRLVERTSHTRSDVFAPSGSGLLLFRVVEFVPDTRAGR